MDFEETKEKIQQVIKEIESVEATDTLDDIKDVELLESFIRERLFNYCQEKEYDIKGFPFVQLEKIEKEEPGYDDDFMTYERIDLYIHRLALEKQDVFELCSLGYKYFSLASGKEEVLELMKEAVSLLEGGGISLELTEEELEYLNREEEPLSAEVALKEGELEKQASVKECLTVPKKKECWFYFPIFPTQAELFQSLGTLEKLFIDGDSNINKSRTRIT